MATPFAVRPAAVRGHGPAGLNPLAVDDDVAGGLVGADWKSPGWGQGRRGIGGKASEAGPLRSSRTHSSTPLSGKASSARAGNWLGRRRAVRARRGGADASPANARLLATNSVRGRL